MENERQKFSFLCKNIWCGCQSCNLPVHGIVLRANEFFKKNKWFLISVSDLDQNISAICRRISGGVVKIAIQVSRETFWWQTHFFKKLWFYDKFYGHPPKKLRPFVENFWRGCQNCILGVDSNIFLKKNFFSRKNLYILSFPVIERRDFSFFLKVLRLGVTTAPGVSMEHFDQKYIFWEKLILFNHVSLLSGTFAAIFWKKMGWVVKVAFYVSIWTFFWWKLSNF